MQPHRPARPTAVDFSQVLVVANSPVNRVVVSKIVERSGLKPVCESPKSAEKALGNSFPGTVILDGGSDNHECDGLLAGISALRQSCGRPYPGVILLSTRNAPDQEGALNGLIDAVVPKPITPERLQPVVDRLIGKHARA
ncbi:MAG: response regulator [Rhizobiaceae bacterium]|nr:response regulator [Rhizobiaceae bacterium]